MSNGATRSTDTHPLHPPGPMTLLLWILLALNAATLAVGWRLYRRTGGRAGPDGAEATEVRSRYLEDLEASDRWRALDLQRLHPVNREEVLSLLRRVEGASVRALARGEREFLDRMVEAQRRSVAGSGGGPRPVRPHPRGA